jgi:hypothetical protein
MCKCFVPACARPARLHPAGLLVFRCMTHIFSEKETILWEVWELEGFPGSSLKQVIFISGCQVHVLQ